MHGPADRLLGFHGVFTIFVIGPDRSTSRSTFDDREVTFGRADGNDVVLKGRNISRRHARLVVRDGKYAIVDLKSTNGTFVNGRRLTSPLVIGFGDKFFIGDFTLMIEDAELEIITKERPLAPFLPRDKVEADLLRAIAAGDDVGDATRAVYADWLEEHGHVREAEFIRLQQALRGLPPEDSTFERRTRELRELAQVVDYRWRVRVARPAIERCGGNVRFDFQCPKDWGSLAATEREDQRFCGSCKQHVHYCTTVPEARDHAARGECVALDLRAQRWHQDVEPPYGETRCTSCRSDLGDAYFGHDCPQCGEAVEREPVMVGMMA